MSGDAQIAMRIGRLDEQTAVKKCLVALFTHELSNADRVMPSYKADYEKHLAAHAKAWDPTNASEAVD